THSFLCLSFKRQLFEAMHNFNLDTFKLALYTSAAILTPDTTAYLSQDELPPLNGYVTGGQEINVNPPVLAGNVAMVDFDDVAWTNASFTARRALAYNVSKPGWP